MKTVDRLAKYESAMEQFKKTMPICDVRRILERGEWWEHLEETDCDAPPVWIQELWDLTDALQGLIHSLFGGDTNV